MANEVCNNLCPVTFTTSTRVCTFKRNHRLECHLISLLASCYMVTPDVEKPSSHRPWPKSVVWISSQWKVRSFSTNTSVPVSNRYVPFLRTLHCTSLNSPAGSRAVREGQCGQALRSFLRRVRFYRTQTVRITCAKRTFITWVIYAFV